MIAVLLVLLCVVFRVVPHPPNYAPVGATAVFAGRTMPPLFGVGLVVLGMFLGDAALAWMHGYPLVSGVTPFVYGGFVAQWSLGRVLRRRRFGAVIAALLGSIAFFMLSNFGVWAAGNFYSHDAAGLSSCFVAAIPFFGATVLGDLIWTLILTAAHAALARRFPAKAVASVASA